MDQLLALSFTMVDFLVHILELPFSWASHAMDEILVNKIGRVKEID